MKKCVDKAFKMSYYSKAVAAERRGSVPCKLNNDIIESTKKQARSSRGYVNSPVSIIKKQAR